MRQYKFTKGVNTNNITIIINKPKHSGNIGSAARCTKNMGIENIFVIDPMRIDDEEIKRMATHCASDVVDNIRYFDCFEKALEQFNYVVGTTARLGSSTLRQQIIDPWEMAEELIPVSQDNKIAIIFGPEDRGLTNAELKHCDLLVTIPVSDKLKSINLSHAIMIICYEIFLTCKKPVTIFSPRIATFAEKEAMYENLKNVLIKIGFINHENPDYWMINMRHFFSRIKLLAKDVKIIRGICRQVDLYGKGAIKTK